MSNTSSHFVLIWVDDKDPRWIAEKNKYKSNHKTICINDSEKLKDFEGAKRKILKAFENKLPDKSSFEL